MSTQYIVTKDTVLQEVVESDSSVSSQAVKIDLYKKLDIAQGVEHKEKFLKVDTVGDITFDVMPQRAQAAWDDTEEGHACYILHKPFMSIGDGLKVDPADGVLTLDKYLHYMLFNDLPDPSEQYAQVIALKYKSTSGAGNRYNKYLCINTGTQESPSWEWLAIGDTSTDVILEQNKERIRLNTIPFQTADETQSGLIKHEDFVVFKNKQDMFPNADEGSVATYTSSVGQVSYREKDPQARVGSEGIIDSKIAHREFNVKENETNKVYALSDEPSNDHYMSEPLTIALLNNVLNKTGYQSEDTNKIFSIKNDGTITLNDSIQTLPSAEAGTSLVYYDDAWNLQDGYGYIDTATSTAYPFSSSLMPTDRLVSSSLEGQSNMVGAINAKLEKSRDVADLGKVIMIRDDGTGAKAVPTAAKTLPETTVEGTAAIYNNGAWDKQEGYGYEKAGTYTTIDKGMLPDIPTINTATLQDKCVLVYKGADKTYDGKLVEALSWQGLTTTQKTFVGAINENKTSIGEIPNVITVKVVTALPEPKVNNTLYYVGQNAAYTLYLYVENTLYNLGTNDIDTSLYINKNTIVDNLTTDDATKVLSAKQGKVLADKINSLLVKQVNAETFTIQGHNKILTNDTNTDLLLWDGIPLTTNTERNYKLNDINTASRWNITLSTYGSDATGMICEERTVAGKRTIEGKELKGVIKITECVNVSDKTTYAKEEFCQYEDATKTNNVWVKLYHYGTTSGNFDGTPTYSSAWVQTQYEIEDSIATEKEQAGLSARQGIELDVNKLDRNVGKEHAKKQVIIDNSGYISFATNIYTIKIYKNIAATSGTGSVEVFSSDSTEDVSTVDKRLTIMKKYMRHCVLGKNLKTVTYLNEANFAKTVDGKDILLDGTEGDVMLEVDTIYWKCYNTSSYYEWKFSTYMFDEGCLSAHLYDGTYRKHRYFGVFLPTLDNDNRLCSASLEKSTYENKITNLYNMARENGKDLGEYNTYGLFGMLDFTLLVILHMFVYATKDIQSVAKGNGLSETFKVNSDFNPAGGWTQGTTADYAHCCTTLGITNVYSVRQYYLHNALAINCRIYCAPDSAMFHDITGSNIPSNWVDTGVVVPNVGATYPYVKDVYGEASYAPFAVRTQGGSSNTYFADGFISANWYRLVMCGGGNEAKCGLFFINIYHPLNFNINGHRTRLMACSLK